jgi:hypothetical protein
MGDNIPSLGTREHHRLLRCVTADGELANTSIPVLLIPILSSVEFSLGVPD